MLLLPDELIPTLLSRGGLVADNIYGECYVIDEGGVALPLSISLEILTILKGSF